MIQCLSDSVISVHWLSDGMFLSGDELKVVADVTFVEVYSRPGSD